LGAPPSSVVICSKSLFTPDKELFKASADGLGDDNIGVITALCAALLLSSVNGMGGHDDGTGGFKFKGDNNFNQYKSNYD